ncbi:MAG: hypothetical protein KF817_08895 [Phycisphaeraceae bacterium]|nr:hypothetical protein [Phycisphaeraceae bacterium]
MYPPWTCPGRSTVTVLPAGAPAGATTVRHVPADYATIQQAISAAVPGDTVLIAPGVYTGPGNRDLDPGGRSIEIRGADGAAETIIDCEGSESSPRRGFVEASGGDFRVSPGSP